MARTRSIKPSFFDNEILGDLPPLTRLLFIGLWGIADREGQMCIRDSFVPMDVKINFKNKEVK